MDPSTPQDPGSCAPEPPPVASLDALRLAKLLKEDLVRMEGIGADLCPMLILHHEGQHLGVIAIVGDQSEVLATTATAIALSDADEATHSADSYSYHPPPGAGREAVYGDLPRWFAEGDPYTSECLMTYTRWRDGRARCTEIPYTYDGRTLVWGDTWDPGRADDMTGAVVAAITKGFEAQATRPAPALTVAEIAVLLGCSVAMPVMARPPRNKPCPCGSGLKAKLCCWAAT